MDEKKAGAKALILTVGTGNQKNLKATLINPIKKSIETGDWTRIVLLPSRNTAEHAEDLQKAFPKLECVVEPLKESGDENDTNTCYALFALAIDGLLTEGFRPENMVVNFTRGTKAMSAALVAVAIRYGISDVRYMYSDRRDARGAAIPGYEKIGESHVIEPLTHRRVDRIRELMRLGDFAGASVVLMDPMAAGSSKALRDVLPKL